MYDSPVATGIDLLFIHKLGKMSNIDDKYRRVAATLN